MNSTDGNSTDLKSPFLPKIELSDSTSIKREQFAYVWSLERFGDILDRKYELSSPVFAPDEQQSAKWRIVLFYQLLYPKGVSVGMVLTKISQDRVHHGVKYSVYVIDKKGKHILLHTREKVFRICSDCDDFVLISESELKEKNLLQSDGTLSIRCEMDIVFVETEDEAEIECLNPPIKSTVAFGDLNNLSSQMPAKKAKKVNIGELTNDDGISNSDLKFLNVYNDTTPKVASVDSSLVNLSDQFKSLYMTKNFYDVLVCVDNMEMRAHKAILSARSEYFRKACEAAIGNKIVVSDVKGATLEAILYYLYTGQMRHLTPDFARDLLPASQRFKIPHLEKVAVEFLKSNINANNVAELLQLSEELKIGDLKFYALKFLSSL